MEELDDIDYPREVAEANQAADVNVSGISAHGGGGAIVISFNAALISVSCFTSSSQGEDIDRIPLENCRIEDLISSLFSQAMEADGPEHDEIADEILIPIMTAGREAFLKVAPPKRPDYQTVDPALDACLYPPRFSFRLFENASGNPEIVQIENDHAYEDFSVRLSRDDNAEADLNMDIFLPRHSYKAIISQKWLLHGMDTHVCRTEIGGVKMLCKAKSYPLRLEMEGELRCLQKIRKFDQNNPKVPRKRLPELLGYVEHDETGSTLGFLQQWMPGCDLFDIVDEASTERKQKWASQIREILDFLQSIDAILYNNKYCNVHVDENDDAWVVDFCNGFMKSWEMPELFEILEGKFDFNEGARRI